MAQKYYVYIEEQVQGPHELGSLLAMNLDGETKVCPEGSTEWSSIGQLRSSLSSLSPSSPDYIPPQVGKYKVLYEVGRGGMGSVYLAVDEILNRKVAIKELKIDEHKKKDADSYNTLIRRFKKEAQVLAQLNHKNIVSVFDVVEQYGNQYIIMEFLDGKNLEEVVEEKNGLEIPYSSSIVADVCLALDYIHKKNIIHRDIKPSNVVILKDGTVKLTDFGVTRDLNSVTMTIDGSLVGTIAYASPEQDSRELDGRSDIFSLGVVLYELVTGQKPFTGDTIASVLLKIATKEPTKPSQVNPQVYKMLENIILKAMSKNLNSRYATAMDMYNDLVRYKEAVDSNDTEALAGIVVGGQAPSGNMPPPMNRGSGSLIPPNQMQQPMPRPGSNTLPGQKMPLIMPIQEQPQQVQQPEPVIEEPQPIIPEQHHEQESIQDKIRANMEAARNFSDDEPLREEKPKETIDKSSNKDKQKQSKGKKSNTPLIVSAALAVVSIILMVIGIFNVLDLLCMLGAIGGVFFGVSATEKNPVISYILTFLSSLVLFFITKSLIITSLNKLSTILFVVIDFSIILIGFIISFFIIKALDGMRNDKNLKPIGSIIKAVISVLAIILFISGTDIVTGQFMKSQFEKSKLAKVFGAVIPKFVPGKKLPGSFGKPSTPAPAPSKK